MNLKNRVILVSKDDIRINKTQLALHMLSYLFYLSAALSVTIVEQQTKDDDSDQSQIREFQYGTAQIIL